MASTRLLLVDAFNLIRRIYEARPGSEDNVSDVISASKRSVERALRDHSPTHVCIVFDSHDKTWRHLLYPDYKKNRKPTPDALLSNVAVFADAFGELGLKSLKVPNYEADDQIATLAYGVSQLDESESIILSTDKSFLQLLRPGLKIFYHFEGIELTLESTQDRFGVAVSQLTDLWAMAGDASNNIKGVPRIGAKTAVALLQQYGSLEEILRTDDENSSADRVRAAGDVAQRCKQLVTLKTDVALDINLKSLRLVV